MSLSTSRPVQQKRRSFTHGPSILSEAGIPCTRENWRGRIRACRAIGAALPADEVECFDREYDL
jgi:hypothetical protein